METHRRALRHHKAKKIASKSCGQVNAPPAESVKGNLPDVPSVAHETQEELQKLRLMWMCAGRPLDGHDLTFETLRRLPANVLHVSYFPVSFLAYVTFRAALGHI